MRGNEWEDALYKVLELDNFDMLRLSLARVGGELQKTEKNITSVPVIVLDIPRPTKDGTAWLRASLVWSLVVCACDREEWTPSRASPKSCRVTAATPMPGPKLGPNGLSEGLDAGYRGFSLAGATRVAQVIVCASSAAMAATFDAGGSRQTDIYVDDLTREEAEKLLGLWGHDNWQEFTAACASSVAYAHRMLLLHRGIRSCLEL